jgi:hypothetical protein
VTVPKSARPRGWRQDYALSLVLLVLYVATQVGSAIVGWVEFVAQQTSHGETPKLLGDDGYIWTFLEQTLQNWQSEFLALAVLVALSAVLIHRDSKQSRDGQDEAQQRIQAIQRRVDRLAAERGS